MCVYTCEYTVCFTVIVYETCQGDKLTPHLFCPSGLHTEVLGVKIFFPFCNKVDVPSTWPAEAFDRCSISQIKCCGRVCEYVYCGRAWGNSIGGWVEYAVWSMCVHTVCTSFVDRSRQRCVVRGNFSSRAMSFAFSRVFIPDCFLHHTYCLFSHRSLFFHSSSEPEVIHNLDATSDICSTYVVSHTCDVSNNHNEKLKTIELCYSSVASSFPVMWPTVFQEEVNRCGRVRIWAAVYCLPLFH